MKLISKNTFYVLLQDDELQGIKELIDSAILDREVKGGLRWPLGNAVSGDKIRVTAVWHVISKKYKNPSLKLKIKNVDRYKFLSSTEEPRREVVIMLKGVASELMVYISFVVNINSLNPAEH